MKADQISITEKKKNKDGSVTYKISMPKEQFTKVSKILAKEGYTIESYLIEFLKQLVKENADGPIHQWLDEIFVKSGVEVGVKKQAIAKTKR